MCCLQALVSIAQCCQRLCKVFCCQAPGEWWCGPGFFTLTMLFMLHFMGISPAVMILTLSHSCGRRFFTLILLLFMLHSMGIGLFRFNGALCRNENVASTGGAFLFLVLLLLGGFLLAKDDIPPWWIWCAALFSFLLRVAWHVSAVSAGGHAAPMRRWIEAIWSES